MTDKTLKIKLMSDEELQGIGHNIADEIIDRSDGEEMYADCQHQSFLGAKWARDECERRAAEKFQSMAKWFYDKGYFDKTDESFKESITIGYSRFQSRLQQYLKEQEDGGK